MNVPARIERQVDSASSVKRVRVPRLIFQPDGDVADSGINSIERGMYFLLDKLMHLFFVLEILRDDFDIHDGSLK